MTLLEATVTAARLRVVVGSSRLRLNSLGSEKLRRALLRKMRLSLSRIRKEANITASIYDPELFVRHPGGVLA